MGFGSKFLLLFNSSEKGLNGDLNPDLCDAGAALYQLSYQANWEKVVMQVNYKPINDALLALICK